MNMHHYNPDWLSDEELVSNFVARQTDFGFLRDELAHMPLHGSIQHYLLVGLRGAGKTTLLKRLAVAIRQDEDIKNHLIALSFPEELYQVKNLSDFWWAACDALVDELDRQNKDTDANHLEAQIARRKHDNDNPLADDGLQLLQESCDGLARRPVLLVDNLDFIFQRIDKKGRKLKDDNSPAYWALREALSTQRSPIVIGGSTRLSEPFTDYDKAFYDFFIPRRLGKLSLKEAQQVLEQLARSRNLPQVEKQLTASTGRIETLHELTGGNPRALSFIFELLRQGPNSRALNDFIRLMDMTTPYYKARFEELSEQAQVVMHALAVRRPGKDGLRFGHTASEIGDYCGLPTNTVSTQLDVLGREGLVEKCADYGRMQYRIMEQLFRLWLQMRANRRIRQNVIGLAEFLEALFELDDLPAILQGANDVEALAHARFAFALAETQSEESLRREMETDGVDHLFQHLESQGGDIKEYLSPDDLPEDLNAILTLRNKLREHPNTLSSSEQAALIGSTTLSIEQKQNYIAQLCSLSDASMVVTELRHLLQRELGSLLRSGFTENDASQLYSVRMRGYLPLPHLAPENIPQVAKCGVSKSVMRELVWRLLGVRNAVKFDARTAEAWFNWGMQHISQGDAGEWARVAGNMRRSKQWVIAGRTLKHAMTLGHSFSICYEQAVWAANQKRYDEAEMLFHSAIELNPADATSWYELASVLLNQRQDFSAAERAYRSAIESDPDNADSWNALGNLLNEHLNRFDEAETAYRRALALAPGYAMIWRNLGLLLANKLQRFDEAEKAYRKALDIDSTQVTSWRRLGTLLTDRQDRLNEAEAAYREALKLKPDDKALWNDLGCLLTDKLANFGDAELAYREALRLDPDYNLARRNLGLLLANKLQRFDEAEATYREVLASDPNYVSAWTSLGNLLANKLQRFDEAEKAYRKALTLDSSYLATWNNLGNLLANKLQRFDEAEAIYREALVRDPDYGLVWLNLGNLLDKQQRLDEALQAYEKGKALQGELSPFWQQRYINLQIRPLIQSAQQALAAYDSAGLEHTLSLLLSECSSDSASALVSTSFVEGFLALVLQDEGKSALVLGAMQTLGYEKYARPLLLAFEAMMTHRHEMLAVLEPEIQTAAQQMLKRLTAGMKNHNKQEKVF
ncbi:tetratricopeptide repeat protein [Pectobacterium sp. A5351]|uniref:tetratricopeptide repeat protein n=1 Tax=Pectobacterium sp. A5351 TaxID=2914983 RepID=UPI00232F13F1|nr:tetratricopeptide repeat protein [Pectobacterium sp. A5351]WCG83162.1 tetratricopeptide repeat protein [Pectobacterium sp. A5351]